MVRTILNYGMMYGIVFLFKWFSQGPRTIYYAKGNWLGFGDFCETDMWESQICVWESQTLVFIGMWFIEHKIRNIKVLFVSFIFTQQKLYGNHGKWWFLLPKIRVFLVADSTNMGISFGNGSEWEEVMFSRDFNGIFKNI